MGHQTGTFLLLRACMADETLGYYGNSVADGTQLQRNNYGNNSVADETTAAEPYAFTVRTPSSLRTSTVDETNRLNDTMADETMVRHEQTRTSSHPRSAISRRVSAG